MCLPFALGILRATCTLPCLEGGGLRIFGSHLDLDLRVHTFDVARAARR